MHIRILRRILHFWISVHIFSELLYIVSLSVLSKLQLVLLHQQLIQKPKMSTSDYFDDYFFTSNLTQYVCPDFGSNQCKPPNACARDPKSGKTYCCDSQAPHVCWSTTEACAKDGSTSNCGDGQNAWCCLSKTFVHF